MEIDISTLLGLKKVIAPLIYEFGFEYTGKLDSISWTFSRNFEEAIQYITFEKIGANPDCMRFKLNTSVSKEVLYHNQLDKNLDLLCMAYSDEGSFHKVLETFAGVITSRGIEWLNIMSRPRCIAEQGTLFSVC